MSLISVVDLLRKEFRTLGVPDILELAVLSSSGKVLYTDLSKASMARISPFYNNILVMGRGDNLTLTLDPVKSVAAYKVSNKALLITMTDKKVGIVLTKMASISQKYGELIDEVITLEEAKSKQAPPQQAVAAKVAPKPEPQPEPQIEAPEEAPPPGPQPEPVADTAEPESVAEPEVEQEQPATEAVQEQPTAEVKAEQPTVEAEEPKQVSTPAPEVVSAATRIIDDARIENRVLRMLGGVAVAMRCPSAKESPLARQYPDIDFFAHAKDDIAIKKLLSSLGYQPIKKFNAIHGRKRLKFYSEQSGIGIDIYLDAFEMCHKLNFKDRLQLDEYTITLADLLMSKLQMVRFTDRDARDTIAIIKDHDFGAGDPDRIDVDYIAKLCSDDWGLYKTLSMNAEIISGMVLDYHFPEADAQAIRARFTSFLKRLEDEPKTTKWKKRALIGEKSQWYENIE